MNNMFVPIAVDKFINFFAGLCVLCIGFIALLMCTVVVVICIRYIIEMRGSNNEEPAETWKTDLGESETDVSGQTPSEEEDAETIDEE